MVRTKILFAATAMAGSLSLSGPAFAASLKVVAAENFYGDLARQIGSKEVSVTSILSNPDQDPHLFETDPSTARELSSAKITIANGADYDPWMDKLLKADPGHGRAEIVVADLVGKKPGDNPHLWYDPSTMKALSRRLASAFAAVEPARKATFERNAEAFEASLKPLEAKIVSIKTKFPGAPVTASEPVFGYMADLLGLTMRNGAFQTAVMNNTEPSPANVAAFEDDLKSHKVKLMIYNSQADDQAVKRLVEIAKASKVPVVGVTETEPAGKTYQSWMSGQLEVLEKALGTPGS